MGNNDLSKELLIKCQWCMGSSTLEEWDNTTYSNCTSREMRRAYMRLYTRKAYYENSGKFYKCPKCGKWLKGCQLIVHNNEGVIKGIGGKPVIGFSRE